MCRLHREIDKTVNITPHYQTQVAAVHFRHHRKGYKAKFNLVHAAYIYQFSQQNINVVRKMKTKVDAGKSTAGILLRVVQQHLPAF